MEKEELNGILLRTNILKKLIMTIETEKQLFVRNSKYILEQEKKYTIIINQHCIYKNFYRKFQK